MVGLLEQAHLDILDRGFDAARAAIWQALALADRCQSAASQVECVAAFGELLAHEGRIADGIALMRWAFAQPTLDRLDRDIVQRRLDTILRRGVQVAEVSDLASDAPLAEVLARVPSR
jgi:hypothetical protein